MVMKRKCALVQNMRGWPLGHSRFMKTIGAVANKINNNSSIVVASLSEMIPGKNRIYLYALESLLTDEWIVVLPKNFDVDTHWRSAINILLIRKSVVDHIESLEIPTSSGNDFSGLYCYIRIYFSGEKEPLYIMSNHHVQLDNSNKPIDYQMKRMNLANDFWNATIAELFEKAARKILFMGDHNAERDNGVNSDKIALVEQFLTDTYVGPDNGITYTDPAGNGHRYDHVFSNFGGVSYIDYEPTTRGYSDHNSLIYSFV